MAVIATVGVPKEIKTAEHRVAMTPDGVRELERHGINVYVEAGAGAGASISDGDYGPPAPTSCRPPPTPGRSRWWSRCKEPKGEEFGVPAPRPHAVHLPPPRRLSRGRRGAGRGGHTGDRLRDGAARQRGAAAAGADERGGRPAGAADGRPLPRAPQRRPRRADGRRARRAAGAGGRARRRQRRLERGVDRRRHGGRGGAARQEPRPPAVGRPDPPGPDHDAGVEPRRDRAQPGRRRPGDRRRAGRRRARAGGGDRGHGARHEAAVR